MSHDNFINHDIKINSWWNHHETMDFVGNWFLMSSLYTPLAITVLYLLFVLKIGPDFMKKRQAYSLQNILLLYNIAQVYWSAYMLYLFGELMWTHGFVSKTCGLETEDSRNKLATAMYWYFIAKISELLDTVFFILRKKDKQVTFLHVYHHAIMIGVSWAILKYEPTYTSIYFRGINCLIHVLMYVYYGLSAFPSLSKFLWWKKYLTGLQLVQFVSVFIHFTLTYVTSNCRPSLALSVTILWNCFLFFYLFSKFYIASYIKSSKQKLSH